MVEAALDSSIVIGLCFRRREEQEACAARILADCTPTVSAYVTFEVAKGYVRKLIVLHNESRTFADYGQLTAAARSGQRRYTYEMDTWLGAFEDFWEDLAVLDEPIRPTQMLKEFQAKLRNRVRRGWSKLTQIPRAENRIRCREDVYPPLENVHGGLLDQRVPRELCGEPQACGLDEYLQRPHRDSLVALVPALRALPTSRLDRETRRRADALERLLGKRAGEGFIGGDCWACGDAFICHEATPDAVMVTKNIRHFKPICIVVGKSLSS